jgi:hypothetical protein
LFLYEIGKANKSGTERNQRVGKHVFDMFPGKNGLEQGVALSPLLFKFDLEYAIRRIQVKQDPLKLNGTHQI